MKKECNNCNWCEREGEDLVCSNDNSEYVIDDVDEKHSCEEWSGQDED